MADLPGHKKVVVITRFHSIWLFFFNANVKGSCLGCMTISIIGYWIERRTQSHTWLTIFKDSEVLKCNVQHQTNRKITYCLRQYGQ